MDQGAAIRHGDNLAEIQHRTKVDLAAAHRIANIHKLNEGISNHLTARVPGCDDRYYQIPYGTHWSEVTASCFMEVAYKDRTRLVGKDDDVVELSTYTIHAPIHRLNPGAAVVMHTHMPFASTLARMKDQRIRPAGMAEAGFALDTAYDENYPGIRLTDAEGERLNAVLGDKRILMMGGHGIVVIGASVADAYDRLYYLERACRVLVQALWTRRELQEIPQDLLEATASASRTGTAMIGGRPSCDWHFDALKRLLDRDSPGYAN